MADQESNLPEVTIRAVLDRTFRQALVDQLDLTLAIAQLPLTADEIKTLQGMGLKDWENLSLHEVEDRIGAGSAGLGISLKLSTLTIA